MSKPQARRAASPGHMSLPVMSGVQPAQAKFQHETGISLRVQVFLTVRDAEQRIATQRIEGYDGWCLQGEGLLLNESPDAAALRVAKGWYATPLNPRLDRVLSFPATGGEDNRWYLVFIYTADAPADLKATDDCQTLEFHSLSTAPGEWAMSHGDVWQALGGK